MKLTLKSIYPIDVISGRTNKGELQYLNGLKGPKEVTYLYKKKILSLR